MSVLIPIEGVLRDGEAPIREGLFLYKMLVDADTRVVLTTTGTRAMAEHWLMVHGIKGYAGIMDRSFDLADGVPLWQRHIAAAHAAGRLDVVFAIEPDAVRHCMEASVTSVLFAHPRAATPRIRDELELIPWAEIQKLNEAKAMKEWTDGE